MRKKDMRIINDLTEDNEKLKSENKVLKEKLTEIEVKVKKKPKKADK